MYLSIISSGYRSGIFIRLRRPEDIFKYFLSISRQRRQLVSDSSSTITRGLHPPYAFVVPNFFQCLAKILESKQESPIRFAGKVRWEPSVNQTSFRVDRRLIAFGTLHFVQRTAVQRRRIGKPVLPSSGMGEVDYANVDFAPFATATGAPGNRTDKEILAVRVAQSGSVLLAIHSGTRTLEGLSSLAPRGRMLLCRRFESFLRLTIPVVYEKETAAIKAIAFQPVDNACQTVELLQEDGNLIC